MSGNEGTTWQNKLNDKERSVSPVNQETTSKTSAREKNLKFTSHGTSNIVDNIAQFNREIHESVQNINRGTSDTVEQYNKDKSNVAEYTIDLLNQEERDIIAKEILKNVKKEFKSQEYKDTLRRIIKKFRDASHHTHKEYEKWKVLRADESKKGDDLQKGQTSVLESLKIFRDHKSYSDEIVENNIINILERWDKFGVMIRGDLRSIGISPKPKE